MRPSFPHLQKRRHQRFAFRRVEAVPIQAPARRGRLAFSPRARRDILEKLRPPHGKPDLPEVGGQSHIFTYQAIVQLQQTDGGGLQRRARVGAWGGRGLDHLNPSPHQSGSATIFDSRGFARHSLFASKRQRTAVATMSHLRESPSLPQRPCVSAGGIGLWETAPSRQRLGSAR